GGGAPHGVLRPIGQEEDGGTYVLVIDPEVPRNETPRTINVAIQLVAAAVGHLDRTRHGVVGLEDPAQMQGPPGPRPGVLVRSVPVRLVVPEELAVVRALDL